MGRREECGRNVYIENYENRFADMEKREGGGWEEGARADRPQWQMKNDGQRYLSEKHGIWRGGPL